MTTTTYDPFQPGFAVDPYPTYEAMRRDDPVHRSPFGFWVLWRYNDVHRFLRDPGLSADPQNLADSAFAGLLRPDEGPGPSSGPTMSMLSRDPPDHTRLRRLVSKAFTPQSIEALHPRIDALVESALDAAAERGTIELIGDLAFPLPFQVISEMMGMPGVDTSELRKWTGLLVRNLEPVNDPDTLAAMEAAGESMWELLEDMIAWKRDHLDDDLLSRLIQAEEDGQVLDETELVDQVALLYIAGHETTVNLIGNGGLALARNPDQWERWRADEGLGTTAVEELLRYDSPVQTTRRITTTAVEVDSHTIGPGEFVALMLASANRDEAHWGPTAAELDLGRADARDHLSFGGGHHHCLGAALARLEGRSALGGLVRRFAPMRITAEPTWNGRINLRGLSELHLATSSGSDA